MRNFNQLYRLIFLINLILIFSLSGILIQVPSAWGHRPHDVVDQVELSPNYDQNQTLFIIVRGNLFKSQDGGNSWQRLWKGLDNFDNLVTLSTSSDNENILFTSSLYSGIYKSQDGGQSWTKVNNGLDLENTKIDLLEISPHSDNVVLAADSTQGLYKTENSGENWTKIYDNVDQSKITKISFAVEQPQMIFVGDNLGNLKISKDGGKTWDKRIKIDNNAAITALFISPKFTTDKTIWIGTEKEGIFRIIDGKVFRLGNDKNFSDKLIRDIALSPSYDTDSTIFVSTWHQGIFRSQDGGKTWEKYNQGLTKSEQANQKQFSASHFNEIRISNNFKQDKTLYLSGFDGLFKSTNNGENWQAIDSLSSRIVLGLAVSPNYQNDATVAVINYVGEANISYDSGQSWSLMKYGLELPNFTKSLRQPIDDPRRFFDIAFSPNYAEDETIFLGLLRDYFLKSTDQGKHWKIVKLENVPRDFVRGTFIAISPSFAKDNTVYLATNSGTLYRSTNGGDSFSIVNKLKTKITSLIISPNFSSDKTLYISSFNGIYKSVDQGINWSSITTDSSLKSILSLSLAISPNYKTDKTLISATNKGLFKTEDAGKNWYKINTLPNGKNNMMTTVSISPNYGNDKTFIVTINGKGTFKTVNAGQSFTPIGKDEIYLSRIDTIPSASIPIQFSPNYAVDNTIYGFGSAEPEIYQSTDGGEVWRTIKIPKSSKSFQDYITSIKFLIYADTIQLVKLIVAILIAGFSYFILGYLRLNQKLKLNNSLVKGSVTFIVFLVSVLILYR